MLIKKATDGCGICALLIEVTVNDQTGTVNGCKLVGGCDGQGKALNALISGMPVDWVIDRLSGIRCGKRNTSCSNEISKILQEWKER